MCIYIYKKYQSEYIFFFWRESIKSNFYCVKSVRIRSFSIPYFPAFALNTERYFVSLRIQSECGKMRTLKILNPESFHARSI